MSVRNQLRERDIQKTILDYLALHRIFHWRANTGAFAAEHRGRSRFVRFGKKGQPDIMVVFRGVFIAIEVKRPGEAQTEAQREFQVDLELAGGVYVLACSLEDVTKCLSI